MTRKRIWILHRNKIPFERNYPYALTLSEDINPEVVKKEWDKSILVSKVSDIQMEYALWSRIHCKPS